MTFFNSAPWFEIVALSFLWGAFIFAIHSYYSAQKTRKDISSLTAVLNTHNQAINYLLRYIDKNNDVDRQ